MSIEEAPPAPDRRAPGAAREPLSRERVRAAAVDLADRGGADALTMRGLGQELGVDPMALYRHVRNKDDLLDGALALVVGQMQPAPAGLAWKDALRELAMNARRVMVRHPWARGDLEERGTAGEAMVGQIERVLAILLAAGFGLELAHHAIHVLDSRIFGFSPALFDESRRPAPPPEASAALALAMATRYPNVAQLAAAASHDGPLGACDDDVEFAFDQQRRGTRVACGGGERVPIVAFAAQCDEQRTRAQRARIDRHRRDRRVDRPMQSATGPARDGTAVRADGRTCRSRPARGAGPVSAGSPPGLR